MDYISPNCKSKRRLEGLVAIVTGCNSGIGLETAKDLYTRGAKVILACLNKDFCHDAEKNISTTTEGSSNKGVLSSAVLDLADLESVRKCAKNILQTEDKIDILINNAGVLSKSKNKTADGFEINVGINHLGHALFTLLLLPRLVKSSRARIVSVASMIHEYYPLKLEDIDFTVNFDAIKAYARSKSAIVLFSKALDIKLKEHKIPNVNTYSVHPGYVKSTIAAELETNIFKKSFNNFLNTVVLQTPRSGAQTSIFCAVDESCDSQSGLYYSKCAVKRCSKASINEELALKLYEETLKAVDLEDPFEDLQCSSL